MDTQPNIAGFLQLLADHLPGLAPRITAILTWIGLARIFAKPFNLLLQRALTRLVEKAKGTQDPQIIHWTDRLLASFPYRMLNFICDLLTSIKLPASPRPSPSPDRAAGSPSPAPPAGSAL